MIQGNYHILAQIYNMYLKQFITKRWLLGASCLSVFLGLGTLDLKATDTTHLEPFKTTTAKGTYIEVPKKSVAGIYPDDPTYISVKRLDNPGMDNPADWDPEAMNAKIEATLEKASRMRSSDMRRNQNSVADSIQVALGYESNSFMNSTPMDNHIAVSNEGIVISVINTNILITDTLGNELQRWVMNASFFGDASLNSIIYDPKILYDPDHNRFILVVLHGNNPLSSRVLVCFSRSSQPHIDGWHYYSFSGNPFNNNLWFDYPNTGINSTDLFITGNLFEVQGNGNQYRLPTIYQINKLQGYEGENLSSRIWGAPVGPDRINTFSGDVPFTLVPAPHAFTDDTLTEMNFVSSGSNSGNSLNLFKIRGTTQGNPVLSVSVAPVSTYLSQRFVPQMAVDDDPPRPSPISLIAGDARIKNAFLQNGILHCVMNARPAQSPYLHILYYRIDLANNTVLEKRFTDNLHDYAFAAIAPFSNDPKNLTTLVVYTSSSAIKYPDIGVLTINKQMEFSSPLTVKEGESFVNVYPQQNRTRWGDYSGIAKRHSADRPEVWISASYGAFTPSQTLSRHWRNWNAKIISSDPETPVAAASDKPVLWPNPYSSKYQFANLVFNAPNSAEYTIVLYDLQGKEVKQLFKDVLLQGSHNVSFTLDALAVGNYIVTIYSDNRTIAYQKMIVVN